MELSVEDLVSWGSQFIWALLRIGGFLMVAPVFGNQLVPARVKVAMAVAIAVVVRKPGRDDDAGWLHCPCRVRKR